MASMLIQHTVKDYAAWRKVFDESATLRKSYGELSSQLYREAGNPNKVTVLNTWDSLANARKFTSSPELRAAMERAGVDGPPDVTFLEEA